MDYFAQTATSINISRFQQKMGCMFARNAAELLDTIVKVVIRYTQKTDLEDAEMSGAVRSATQSSGATQIINVKN